MNDDISGDEAMQRFEDLGRRLFQAPQEEADEDEATEDEPQDDE
jgi:hypothetical protein